MMDLYNSADFGDILKWLAWCFGIWSIWSGGVTGVIENMKPRYVELWRGIEKGMTLLGVPQEVVVWVRKASIGVFVLVAAYVWADGGYNFFDSAPAVITLNETLQVLASAIALAAGAFYFHKRDILAIIGNGVMNVARKTVLREQRDTLASKTQQGVG